MKYAKSAADERRQIIAYLQQSFEALKWIEEFDDEEFYASVERGDHVIEAEELSHPFAILAELGADPSIYRNAIDTFGESAQLTMVIEECGELLSAFAKLQRGRATLEDAASEVADVLVVVLQYSELLGQRIVADHLRHKLERLRSRIDTHLPFATEGHEQLPPGEDSDDEPESFCPNCGKLLPDHDGFGVLAHEECGFCSHPADTEEDCPSCHATGVRRLNGHDYCCGTCHGRGMVRRCDTCHGLVDDNTTWGGL